MEDEDFRGVGNVIVPVDENIAEDWEVLRGLPKYLYMVYRGCDCDSMELWRIHCTGQHRGRRGDHWLYKHDRPLWRGPGVSQDENFGRDVGAIFRTDKKSAFLTLADALEAFNDEWNEHVKRMRAEVKRLDLVIIQYQKDRDAYISKAMAAAPGPKGVHIVAEIEDSK